MNLYSTLDLPSARKELEELERQIPSYENSIRRNTQNPDQRYERIIQAINTLDTTFNSLSPEDRENKTFGKYAGELRTKLVDIINRDIDLRNKVWFRKP